MDHRNRWAEGSRRRLPGVRAPRGAVSAVAAILLVGGLLPLTDPAAAITPQAEQTWETGVIRSVADGDTVIVDISTAADPGFIAPADPAARSYCAERVNVDGSMPLADADLDACRIRLIGIQAPEKAGASGGSALAQCRADAATAALHSVLPAGSSVQLRSISVRSIEANYSGGRLARSVYVQDASGQWVDAGRTVLASGNAMWFPHGVGDTEKPEYVHNLEYRRLVDDAAARGVGMWSANSCGPTAPASVRTWVVSDPIGDDTGKEHLVVLNDSDAALDVSGWVVRDSSLTTLTLPPGTVIAGHDHLRIFTGSGPPGTPTPRDLHFGGPAQMFSNWSPDDGYFHGDGAYVYDVQPGWAYGNLRAWFHYPCDPAACTDPLTGLVNIGVVQYDPPGTDRAAGEYVELDNVSGAPVSLGGYALARRAAQYAFPPTTTIPAGGTLRVSMGQGADEPSVLYLGRTASLLANIGDLITLINLNEATVDCRAWGAFSCAGMPVSGALKTPVAVPATVPATTPAPAAKAGPGATTTKKRPGAPTAVQARLRSKRILVQWAAPAPLVTPKVTKYRARVYLKSGKSLKYRTSCAAKAKSTTCRTKKLKKGRTYVVRVQARNAKGYGTYSAAVPIRVT